MHYAGVVRHRQIHRRQQAAERNKMESKRYMTIREVAKMGIVSECYLRRLEHTGKLPGFYSGVKKLVNVQMLMEQIEKESQVTA